MVSESDFDGAGDDDFEGIIGRLVYACSFIGCGRTFNRKDRLRHHLSVHEGKKPYVCTFANCAKAYTRPAGLKRHVESYHALKKYAQTYSCTEENCDKTFTLLHNLHRHVKRAHDGVQFQCSHCPKTFKKRQQFKIHEFQHTGIKPFKCSIEGCSKEFLLPSKLKAHMKYHNGYKCTSDNCELTFVNWSLMRKHMKANHLAVHKCSTCDQAFSTAVLLRSHETTHGAERQIFTCVKDGCNRFYYFERNLKQHIRNSHSDDDPMSGYKCSHSDCNKQFKHKSSLDKHLKLHTVGEPKTIKPTKTRKSRRRKSMAAHLSAYVGTKEEEMAILYPEKITDVIGNSKAEIPKVSLILNGEDLSL